MKKRITLAILLIATIKAYCLVDFVGSSGLTQPHNYQSGINCELKTYVTISFAVNYEINNSQYELDRTTNPNWNSWNTIHVFSGCGTCGASTFQYDDYGANGGFPNNQFPNDGSVYYYRVRAISNNLNYNIFNLPSFTALPFTSMDWDNQVATAVSNSSTQKERIYNPFIK